MFQDGLVLDREAPGEDDLSSLPLGELVKVYHRHAPVGLDVELYISRKDTPLLAVLKEDLELLKDGVVLGLHQLQGLVHTDAVHLVLEPLGVPCSRNKQQLEAE